MRDPSINAYGDRGGANGSGWERKNILEKIIKKYKCDQCHDTGWYGDNGPGIKGNREYCPCECRLGRPGKL